MVLDLNRRIVVADLTDAEQTALDELVLQWRDKRPRNNLRSAFYDLNNSSQSLMSVGSYTHLTLAVKRAAVDLAGFEALKPQTSISFPL